eukprot:NODE_5489_length_573_cov_67.862595_g4767_i0.p1 GENE.NODE_5489_length_573_cov_67.862595_g4767_i0~~NODE_5489_length_573_cov_67.862595_g4767_i0.p1  ORF type:complete len:164 (-),score=13.01 NODE_5489_length_573_cov_67.862595_g4767_i0:53-544(-)
MGKKAVAKKTPTKQAKQPKATPKTAKTVKKVTKKKVLKKKHKVLKRKAPRVRLYQPGVFLGYKRSVRRQNTSIALLAIKGVNHKADTRFYMGKKCLYAFRATNKKRSARGGRFPHLKTDIRRMWGKIIATHGNSGVVRAKFKHNLPPQAMGSKIRVYLFPSHI